MLELSTPTQDLTQDGKLIEPDSTLEIIILTCQRWYMPGYLHYLEMKEV